MEEKEVANLNQKSAKFEALLPKLFCILCCVVGCLVMLVVPFYVPLLKLLGFTGTMILNGALAVAGGMIAGRGFNFASKEAVKPDSSFSYLSMIYLSSFTMLVLVLMSFFRLLAWAFGQFFNVHIDWSFVPVQ